MKTNKGRKKCRMLTVKAAKKPHRAKRRDGALVYLLKEAHGFQEAIRTIEGG